MSGIVMGCAEAASAATARFAADPAERIPSMPEPSKNLNLTNARSQPSVWDRPSPALQTYDRERWMTAAWGSALTMVGARRGGFGGGLLATLGAVLAVRAAMGRHDLRMARHFVDSAITNRAGARRTSSTTRRRSRSRRATRRRGRRISAPYRGKETTAMNMELTFPEDAREARARSDRNLSGIERWASIAAGAGLTAYGLSRLKSNGWMYAGLGGCCCGAA